MRKLFILLFCLFICFSLSVKAAELMVNGARQPLEAADGLVSLNGIAKVINLNLTVDPLSKIVYIENTGLIRFFIDKNWVVVKNRVLDYEPSAKYDNGIVFIPMPLVKIILENTKNITDIKIGENLISFNTTIRISPKQEDQQIKTAIKKVVIDAGHGGRDPGALSLAMSGIQEKNLTLPISLKIAEYLKKLDPALDVILTRTDDVFVSLRDRTRMANDAPADLFVSIHLNSTPHNKNAAGFEVYHLSFEASDDDAKAVSMFENQFVERYEEEPPPKGVGLIVGRLMKHHWKEESVRAASHIVRAMGAGTSFSNRGVRSAFFYVLRDVTMPSVLVEICYLSNIQDTRKILLKENQDKTAKAIAEGIIKYKKEVESMQ